MMDGRPPLGSIITTTYSLPAGTGKGSVNRVLKNSRRRRSQRDLREFFSTLLNEIRSPPRFERLHDGPDRLGIALAADQQRVARVYDDQVLHSDQADQARRRVVNEVVRRVEGQDIGI